jgi:hypothetical protein
MVQSAPYGGTEHTWHDRLGSWSASYRANQNSCADAQATGMSVEGKVPLTGCLYEPSLEAHLPSTPTPSYLLSARSVGSKS